MTRKPEDNRAFVRTKLVQVRVRPTQHKRWTGKAREQGMSLAEYVRMVVDRDARM